MLGNRKNLMQLFWPVLLETLFGTFMGTIDTWMIASLGDKAVGAVGTANAYLELLIFINICYENGLKTIGDGRFPMIVGSILMIFWAGCGSWLFGMQLGWMSVGVMIAMCLDECTRGLCMVVRWRTGKWQKMALIHAD